MDSILTAPEPKPRSKRRILAIEQDPERASALQRIVRDQVRAELEIVASANDAIRAITERVPDLVLTPPLLPPAEEAALIAHLKRTATPEVQAIIIPQFVDSTEGKDNSRRFEWLLRRSPLRPACDPRTLADQIAEYLEEAHTARVAWNDRQLFRSIYASRSTLSQGRSRPDIRLVKPHPGDNPLSDGFKDRTGRLGRSHARDRRGAARHRSTDLPWLKTIRVSSGGEARIVDVSNTGILVETGSKFLVGTTIDLQLLGQKIRSSVLARVLRSEVSDVDGRGVTYRMAAVFAHDLNILELEGESSSSLTPAVLADILGRVLRDTDGSSGLAVRRTRLEQELRALLPVRDVLIRESPVPSDDESESIYFTVRQVGQSRQVLQVIFEPDAQPSPTEFRFLRAAADLAAVALEFAS